MGTRGRDDEVQDGDGAGPLASATAPEAAVGAEAVAAQRDLDGVVRALFGERAGVAHQFAVHLGTSAVERGLIGPREVPRIWDRHILNCAVVSELVRRDSRLVDVGSGAGLPGIVLAIARPDIAVTLVEPLQRRVTWLDEVVAALGVNNVDVVRGRAEELRGRTFDVATARAVAGLEVLAGWCLPLVVPGGVLLALKGQSAGEELSAAEPGLRRLGARRWWIEQCGSELLSTPTTVIGIEAGEPPASGASRRALQAGRRRNRPGR